MKLLLYFYGKKLLVSIVFISEDASCSKKVKFATKDKEHSIPKVGKQLQLKNRAPPEKPTEEKKPNSIQSDPKASSAYKSLFTTSEKCKNQMKAHWVTHNPGYY